MSLLSDASAWSLTRSVSAANYRLIVLLIFFLLGVALSSYSWYKVQQQEVLQIELAEQLRKIQQDNQLIASFHDLFKTIRRKTTVANARVFWTERLQIELARRKENLLKFRIDDPDILPTNLSGFANDALLQQYAVSVEARLENDQELLGLLQQLSSYRHDLFENRGCRVLRERAGSKLKLVCLFAIYHIQLPDKSI